MFVLKKATSRRNLNPTEQMTAARLYVHDVWSVRSIARYLNVPPSRVYRGLAKSKVVMRASSRVPYREVENRIEPPEVLRSSFPCPEIAARRAGQ